MLSGHAARPGGRPGVGGGLPVGQQDGAGRGGEGPLERSPRQSGGGGLRSEGRDGSPRKLLEDALKDAGGIDDSQTLVSLWEKCLGKPEKTLLWIWDLEEEETPFDGILRSLR